jgi:hypothetical protein
VAPLTAVAHTHERSALTHATLVTTRRSLRPWLIAGIGSGLLAFVLGVAGQFGQPEALIDAPGIVGALSHRIDGLDCPDGEPVTQLTAGEPLLALARSVDGRFVAVRSPVDQFDTVWVAVGSVDVHSQSLGLLPVRGCISPGVQ